MPVSGGAFWFRWSRVSGVGLGPSRPINFGGPGSGRCPSGPKSAFSAVYGRPPPSIGPMTSAPVGSGVVAGAGSPSAFGATLSLVSGAFFVPVTWT